MSLGLSSTTCQPRFLILLGGQQYGSRDEIIGMKWVAGPAFETRAMADRWINAEYEACPALYEDGCADIDLVDLHPERDAANWGPRLPRHFGEVSCTFCGATECGPDCLPF